MRDSVVHRGFTAPLLALGLILADTPTAFAQAPVPAEQVEGRASSGTVQIATEKPRRPRRPPPDPATRELRQARGILAGGIVLTALCGVGFGLVTYALIAENERFKEPGRGRALAGGVTLFACTLASIAGIGVGGKRLRALKSSGRAAWTGGLGLHF